MRNDPILQSSFGWKMRRKGRCPVISGKECKERRSSKHAGLVVGMRMFERRACGDALAPLSAGRKTLSVFKD